MTDDKGQQAGQRADQSGTARGARRLSADELLARPAPLPVDTPEERAVSERLSAAAQRVGAVARDLNERIEPARRAREAGAAVSRIAKRALSQGKATAQDLAAKAAPHAQAASEKLGEAVSKGASGARASAASLSGEVAGAVRSAKDKLSTRTSAAVEALRERRNAEPPLPQSELDRLLAQEEATPAAAPKAPDGLPLFTTSATTQPQTAPPSPVSVQMVPPPAAEPAQSGAAPSASPATKPAQSTAANSPPANGTPPPSAPSASLSDWARHPATWGLAALALLASGFAIGRWSGGGLSAAQVGELVEARLLEKPEIIPQAMERLQANRASAAIAGVREPLTTAFSGAWAGNAQGDVTLVVFTDFACTFCRASEPDLTRLIRTDRNLKVVFRQLPILSADSERAARVALAAARRGQYMTVHRALFETGTPDATARTAALTAAGLTIDQINPDDPAIERELSNNVALARRLGIDGTPTWIVGDRLLTGAVGYDALRAAIAEARS